MLLFWHINFTMRTKKITSDQCKDTGLAIILIALLVVWTQGSTMLLGPAILVLIVTMSAPKLLSPLARLWFGFSHYLGQVVTTLLLTVVFFTVVTPMGLIRKLSGPAGYQGHLSGQIIQFPYTGTLPPFNHRRCFD